MVFCVWSVIVEIVIFLILKILNICFLRVLVRNILKCIFFVRKIFGYCMSFLKNDKYRE